MATTNTAFEHDGRLAVSRQYMKSYHAWIAQEYPYVHYFMYGDWQGLELFVNVTELGWRDHVCTFTLLDPLSWERVGAVFSGQGLYDCLHELQERLMEFVFVVETGEHSRQSVF